MQNFLRQEIEQHLVKTFVELGLDEDRAKLRAFVPENDVDKHLYAHASICVEYFDADEDDLRSLCFLGWSAVVVQAINHEAGFRGMGKHNFPVACGMMDQLTAKIDAKYHKTATRH